MDGSGAHLEDGEGIGDVSDGVPVVLGCDDASAGVGLQPLLHGAKPPPRKGIPNDAQLVA